MSHEAHSRSPDHDSLHAIVWPALAVLVVLVFLLARSLLKSLISQVLMKILRTATVILK